MRTRLNLFFALVIFLWSNVSIATTPKTGNTLDTISVKILLGEKVLKKSKCLHTKNI